jgi:glycosyltransferase involved in cell wall biosynthesis
LFLVASKMTTTNKISVLIPSRNRTIQLVNSVRQILTMAADPGRVEILLRLDCDDEASLRAYRGLRLTVPAIAVVDDRYMGWMSNHVFYNALARQASGDWLLLYNDDAQMLTSAWDNRIMAATKPVVATRMLRSKECEPWRWRAKNGQWMGNCFPAVRRDILHAPTSSVLPETRGPGWWDDFNTDPLKPLLEQDRLKLKEAFCRELL